MKVLKVTGNTLEDLIRSVTEQIEQMASLENNESAKQVKVPERHAARNDHRCECHATPDISKIFWIDKKVSDDTVFTTFNVIAPFAIEKTIKATLNKVEGETWLTLRYTNDDSCFADCMTCNFKARKEIEYKYNFKDFKVDKKKLKLSFNKGVISLFTVSTKINPKNDDFVIGL